MLSSEELRADLPEHLSKAFERMSRGRHVSSDDGDVYYDLQQRFETYQVIFESLGFPLIRNARGFFYFQKESPLSETIEQIAVFVWILVDWLADSGRSISDEILTTEFTTADLPHLKSDRYRLYAERARFGGEPLLKGVLKNMRRLGFLRSQNELETFFFLSPIFRILEAGQAVISVTEAEKAGKEETAAVQADNEGDEA